MDHRVLFSELKAKEVVSAKDCRKLGHIKNLEIDLRTGTIRKIMIPKHCYYRFPFLKETEYVIDYNDICQIGPDIILVNM